MFDQAARPIPGRPWPRTFGVLSSHSERKTPNVAGRQKDAERGRWAQVTDPYLRLQRRRHGLRWLE